MATKRTTAKVTKKTAKQRSKVYMKQAPGFSVWQLSLLSIVGFIAAYVFASLAIDSGSMWHYLLCIMSTYVAIRFLVHAFRAFMSRA